MFENYQNNCVKLLLRWMILNPTNFTLFLEYQTLHFTQTGNAIRYPIQNNKVAASLGSWFEVSREEVGAKRFSLVFFCALTQLCGSRRKMARKCKGK